MAGESENKGTRRKIRISQVIEETPHALTLYFEPLNDPFHYLPGQHIALIIRAEGKELKKYYTLSSSPHVDPLPSVTIKKSIDGKSSWLLIRQIKPGMIFEILGPSGTFTPPLDPGQEIEYIFFAGGSGITPMIPMIKSILHVEPKSNCTLVYQNRNQDSIIFKNALEILERENPGRFRVIHILSRPGYGWSGRRGRINRPAIADILTGIPQLHIQWGQYYICGPVGMIKTVADSLKFLGVPQTNIHFEGY